MIDLEAQAVICANRCAPPAERVDWIHTDEEVTVEQLSWTDDMMLRAERPETPMQIQMLLIYDQTTAPGGRVTFKRILEEIDARLHLAPTFRRRLTELPGGLHMPYWVDDPDFDLEYHVRHIALPQPGDWRQLCIQVARIHGRQVDLRRPPWEMTVIEGLNAIPGVPPGSFAISLKLHHCVVDGMESVELMAAMHDLAPDAARPAPPERPFSPGALPSTQDLVVRTATNFALYPLRVSRVLIPNALKALRQLPALPGAVAGGIAATLGPSSGPLFPPATRFNGAATPHRVFEARFHDLDDFKRIKNCVPGATINDVTLAYVGGALRHYLKSHDELPEEDLVAACPASIRSTSERGAGGNRLFGRLHMLGTAIADPLERLTAIVEQASAYRDSADAEGSSRLMDLVGVVPTTLLGLTVKAAVAMPFGGPTVATTTVSNVPGPTEAIYFAGARLARVTGLGPLIAGMNLFHVVVSYHGTVSIGATADRNALPDPAHYADCMQASFDELLSAASSRTPSPIG